MKDMTNGAVKKFGEAHADIVVWCILDKALRKKYDDDGDVSLTIKEVEKSTPCTTHQVPPPTSFNTTAVLNKLKAVGLQKNRRRRLWLCA
jgi:hypothetical protein